MNSFKRGRYSVVRKPIKSVILGGILYFIAIFLMVALAIHHHHSTLRHQIRNQVGAGFRLELCREDYLRRMEAHMDVYNVEFDGSALFVAPSYFHTLIAADIKQISQADGISDFNINSLSFVVMPVDFERLSITHDAWGAVNLQGILNQALTDEVVHDFISLKEGRWIDANDVNSGGNSLVISEEIAEKNGLTIGDKMTFEWQDTEMDIVLEVRGRERWEPITLSGTIVGIFSVDWPITNHINDTFFLENTLFTNLDFRENALKGIDTYHYTLATFQVADVDDYEQIRQNILNVDIDWERYNLVDADEMLTRLSDDFSGLGQISVMLVTIVMGSGFIMLLLIFTFWIRYRSHEFGILLSIGVGKIKIIGQMLYEALLIAIGSFSLALLSAPFIPRFIDANWLSAAMQEEDFFFEMMAISRVGLEVTLIDHFYEQAVNDISVTVAVMVMVMVAMTGLIFISIFMASLPIIVMKPRDIFSKINS